MSVGSLYQYFPHKLALLAGAKERHLNDLFRRIEAALAQADGLEAGLRAALRANFDASLAARPLLLVCAEELPARLRVGDERPSDAPHVVLLRRFLHRCRGEIPDRDPGLAALIVGEMADAVTRAALHDRPDDLRNGALEAELMGAILLYLRGR